MGLGLGLGLGFGLGIGLGLGLGLGLGFGLGHAWPVASSKSGWRRVVASEGPASLGRSSGS